jgi:type II secretory pathway pseudopilin PulG
MNINARSKHLGAFSVVELLAVLMVVALLAATRLPAFSHTKNRSWDVIDFYNNKQLMMAANMYATDQNDSLPGCGWGTANDAWAYAKNIGGSYSTQLNFLRRGQLFPYVKTENIFMCPIDTTNGLFFARGILVTSYTWNGAVGGYGSLTSPNGLGSYKVAQFQPCSFREVA